MNTVVMNINLAELAKSARLHFFGTRSPENWIVPSTCKKCSHICMCEYDDIENLAYSDVLQFPNLRSPVLVRARKDLPLREENMGQHVAGGFTNPVNLRAVAIFTSPNCVAS